MKKILLALVVVMVAIVPQAIHAQTLHAVVFCNTIDSSIGKSMTVEYQNVLNQVQTLAKLLDYDLDLVKMDGPNCTRARLKKEIDDMNVDSDDVVFTFYGGHGSHAENNASDPWPQYLMNSGFENQGNWVPMATVDKWVSAKNPRLRVIMSNCCNKEQSATTIKPLWADDGRATSLNGLNAENYRKLFAARGSVMATSSKLGQYSWCNVYGGIYTNDFWDAMKQLGQGSVAPNWEALLKKAYDMCSSREIRTNDYPYRAVQNPYYKVNIGGVNPIPYDGPRDDDRHPKNDGSLSGALAQLLDKSVSKDSRLTKIAGIKSRYFGSGMKVITVANDMQTVVDYEDPDQFLRRICLSDYIQQINIVNEGAGVLTVHEVR